MKKAIMILIVAVFVVMLSTPLITSAMTEKEFLNYLKSENLGDYYIQNAESLFKTYDFTVEQLDKAKENADVVLAIIKANNPEALNDPTKLNTSKFTAAQKNEIINNISKTADSLGFKAVTSTDAKGNTVIKFIDKSTNKFISSVSAAEGTLKVTGLNISNNRTLTVILLVAFVAVSTIAIVYNKRKELAA